MEKDFYKNGIKFKCKGSSNCCISRNGYGYVFLSKQDLIRFAKYFKISIKKFQDKYCQKTDGYIHLKEIRKNGECIFLENKKCKVYKSRPGQCRTWPFWPENMNTKRWNNEVINFCPGIGSGEFFSKDKINDIIRIDKYNTKNIIKE